LKKNKK